MVLVNSLVSPLMESSLRLSGIDEEHYVEVSNVFSFSNRLILKNRAPNESLLE